MTNRFQQTLANKVSFIGKGLHSGRFVRMDILPAGADSGIVFERTDTSWPVKIKAVHSNLTDSILCTTISNGVNSVATIEHLCAAFAGLQIDNALIKLNGPEVPIMDGSAFPFLESIKTAGIKRLGLPRKMFLITKKFEVRDGDRFIKAEPSCFSEFCCSIYYANSIIGAQTIDYEHSESNFLRIAKARTFCHLRDVSGLRSQGLALGGGLDNAIVIDTDKVLNESGLRYPDEFVRHKLVDLLGDLILVGGQIIGKIEAHKPGHEMHAFFIKELHAKNLIVEVEVGSIMDKVLQVAPMTFDQSLAYN